MHYRVYNPRLGTFLTPDFRVPDLYDPSTWTEPYGYAAGNPVMYWDPTGLSKIPEYLRRPIHSGLEKINEGQESRDKIVEGLSEQQQKSGQANLQYVWALGAERGLLNTSEKVLNVADLGVDFGITMGFIPASPEQEEHARERIVVGPMKSVVKGLLSTLDPTGPSVEEKIAQGFGKGALFVSDFMSGDVKAHYKAAQATTELAAETAAAWGMSTLFKGTRVVVGYSDDFVEIPLRRGYHDEVPGPWRHLDEVEVAPNRGMTNAVKGEMGEAAARRTLTRAGYDELPARLSRNNGFDGVFIKRSSNGSIQDIIISESKFSSTGRASLTNTKTMGKQMSSEWIDANIQKMIGSSDPSVQATGRLLRRNRAMIRRKANVLNPDGNNL